MNDKIQGLMAKARECVAAARAEFEAARLNSAGNRAYYAMFHAARAALESRGIETGRQRHGTIIREFGRLFVKDGPLEGSRPEPQEGAGAALRRRLRSRTARRSGGRHGGGGQRSLR